MHNVNSDENFRDSFQVACASHGGKATYSQIFRLMEIGTDHGFANPDFVRTKLQAGIKDQSIEVAYGVMDENDNVDQVFSGLKNKPEGVSNDRVEVLYFPV